MIPYFQQDIGLTAAWAAVVMSFVFILSGIGRVGGGYLLDRMDYRLVLAVVAAMMGFSLLYLQLVDVNTVLATLPFALLFGVSFGCLVPMRGAVGSIMFGTRAIGKVLGLLQGGPVAAGVIGPLVMGIIFDLNGNYSVAIWGLIVISALMVPLSLAMASPAELAKRIGAAAEQRYAQLAYLPNRKHQARFESSRTAKAAASSSRSKRSTALLTKNESRPNCSSRSTASLRSSR